MIKKTQEVRTMRKKTKISALLFMGIIMCLSHQVTASQNGAPVENVAIEGNIKEFVCKVQNEDFVEWARPWWVRTPMLKGEIIAPLMYNPIKLRYEGVYPALQRACQKLGYIWTW
jgi:hypothetical protein